MKNSLLKISPLAIITILFLTPQPALAQGDCYGDFAGTPPTLGNYLLCAIPRFWGVFQTIMIGIVIIFTIFLIFKSVTSRDNPTVLETLPSRWMYLIIFALLVFGIGGSALNLILRGLGFGGVEGFLNPLDDILQGWNARVGG